MNYTAQLLAAHEHDYCDLLAEIEGEIAGLSSVPEEPVYPSELFFQFAVDALADAGVLQIPEEFGPDEYLETHLLDMKFGNSIIQVSASAMLRNPEGKWSLHLFAVDYEPRSKVEVLPREEFDKKSLWLSNFVRYSTNGQLQRSLTAQHPAARIARLIYERKADIDTVRTWVLSNRLFDSATPTGRREVGSTEITTCIIDINYLLNIRRGNLGIDQSFSDIGGLPFLENGEVPGQDYRCLLSTIRGITLAHLYSMHGTALVQENVRAHLGKNAVNKKVLATIVTEPARFLAYNNGLVVSALSVDVQNGRIMSLKGIQIINGGQTTANIYTAWREARSRKDPSQRDRELQCIEYIQVPMKLVIAHESLSESERSELRAHISEAANSQTAVKLSDLSANHPFQKRFDAAVRKLKSPDGEDWFYERARGFYAAEEEKLTGQIARKREFKKRYPVSKRLGKTDLALAILAWDGESIACAQGAEKAYAVFADRWSEWEPSDILPETAQTMLAKCILFRTLSKEAKKRLADIGISNPRVPVIYTIGAFAEKYGEHIHWDRIWSRQGLSQGLLDALLDLTERVGLIQKQTMGSFMIAMWGRQKACGEKLKEHLTFEGINFEHVYELGL